MRLFWQSRWTQRLLQLLRFELNAHLSSAETVGSKVRHVCLGILRYFKDNYNVFIYKSYIFINLLFFRYNCILYTTFYTHVFVRLNRTPLPLDDLFSL